MLILRGSSALSGFRQNKVLQSLRALSPDIGRIHGEYLHFADIDGSVSPEDHGRIESLLQYGGAAAGYPLEALSLLVVPRPGTRSPWSSKATDILHNCGLNRIRRVERGVAWWVESADGSPVHARELAAVKPALHDRMTQWVLDGLADAHCLFRRAQPAPLAHIPILSGGKPTLVSANRDMGLALTDEEMDYLVEAFRTLERDPTDVELMMFAQANSEHCRHKIFNASWTVDGVPQDHSLFALIRLTHESAPGRVLSAYRDNAAVIKGYAASRFFPGTDGAYRYHMEDVHMLVKVETHNHPTAIAPFPGAATGAGGEIRDEAATGTGAKPKAGLTGFTVSNLHIPGLAQPWEENNGKPDRIASALDIMLEGPVGAAAYNNEFGRPALCGYFRTYEQTDPVTRRVNGYHKPIMLAGGIGTVRPAHVDKHPIPAGSVLIILGGPALPIGLGGGAASSLASGSSDADLDFASVQRDNAEMQRRCQEVIDRCWAQGESNPILSIHDVGAGGLSNALPELLHAGGRGARLQLRDIPCDDPGMSPLEIWCNEAQERYVLAVAPERVEAFSRICRRERAPFAVIGQADDSARLRLSDARDGSAAVDMPLSVLLGEPPRMQREARRWTRAAARFELPELELAEAARRVLQMPSVADKRFLITIGDRTVSGLVTRDQMVGPWQTPVADCAVTLSGYDACTGEAVATGERSPVAVSNAPASARLAVAEAITNICAARILRLNDVALSANWMAAAGEPGEDAALFDAVNAVSQLARALGVCIPVGKDSLSMSTLWRENAEDRQVCAPVSLVVTAFAPVADIRRVLTPQLRRAAGSRLLLLELNPGRRRMAGSALAQAFKAGGGEAPDLDRPDALAGLFRAVQLLSEMELILAYHDRSDGGLFVTLCEMAFAGRCGVDIQLESADVVADLFNEEPGAVLQVRDEDLDAVVQTLAQCGMAQAGIRELGSVNEDLRFRLHAAGTQIYTEDLMALHRLWSLTSYHMQSVRDNPKCAREEFDQLLDRGDPGLTLSLSFEADALRAPVRSRRDTGPKVAVLREQGVNGQAEMAAAFDRAGFECVDVHMNDLLNGDRSLKDFRGIVACGGFSYGDVLGAGGGWAKSILFNPRLLDEFRSFFSRGDTFSLGVCNGCQVFARLRGLIPGAG
ncbi:MAG: phosphoribosylformylglycinamidine synthase, partial [Gammaproteobacteria bacterium]|nr:phosphoribosylformylglycinamidine synthase [Gammaproteobacteria bacterium]